MKNTNKNNTTKVRRTNKKIAASICAVIAATAMVTGIAVFSASANTSEIAPVRSAFSITVKPDTADTEKTQKPETENKTDKTEKSENTQKAAQPEQNKKDEAVNANGKHPGESGYNYQTVADTNNTQPAVKQAQSVLEVQAEPTAEVVKHPGEAGSNYVDENGKHPGESGCSYQAAADEKTDVTPTAVFSGDFESVNGRGIVLTVAKADPYNTAYCTVKVPNGENSYIVYGFLATVYEDKMYYAGGTKTEMVYDEKGNIVEGKQIDANHEGHIVMTKEGYVWVDSDESTFTFAY